MATIIYLFNDSFISVVFEQKINILGGIFLGLSIYSYFYRRKEELREIEALKKEAIIFEIIKNNLIDLVMSENERYTIKEIVGNLSEDFKNFKHEVRSDIKDLIREFSDYKNSNNDRIALLEGKQKLTTKTIAIYVGFISMFAMLVINTYISLRG